MLFFKRTLPLLLLFFLGSVAIRLPNIGRPLSKHHEFCTAVALRVVQVWYTGGIANTGYNPCMTYPNPADHHINNYAGGTGNMLDAQGRYYYVSHPPLAYYVAYAYFKLLGRPPTVIGLQILEMLFHFLSAIGVYFIMMLLLGQSPWGSPTTAGLMAYILYLFSPATLWFQSNTYMSDMVVMLPFIWGVYWLLRCLQKGRGYMGLLPVVFVMVYTSWLGVSFAVVSAGYLVWSNRKWAVSIGILLSALLALGLMAWQYAHIAGWHNYLAELQQRGTERSFNGFRGIPMMYLKIIANYVFNFLPLLLLLGWSIWLNRGKIKPTLQPLLPFMLMAGLPVLLLHLALADYSGHDFTALYGAMFLAVLVAWLLHHQPQPILVIGPVLLLWVLLSIGQYDYINRPGEISLSGERYDFDQRFGEAIASQSTPAQTIFIIGTKPDPQMVWYAHRNIQRVDDEQAAVAFMQQYGRKQGILFKTDPNGMPERQKVLSLP